MNDTVVAETYCGRELIEAFDQQFALLHSRSCSLIKTTPAVMLYRNARLSTTLPSYSMGENVLRSAAAVEQTFGGITANLWDDPFEWTLPENLSTAARVIEYLEEVEATRKRAFDSFARDSDLLKEVLVPAAGMETLMTLLTQTLVRAADYQGRAIGTLALLSEDRRSAFSV